MKLIFVRHGQTDFNKNEIPQGQEIDAPLNEEGIRQAEEVAVLLPRDIDFIISSPLRRAAQTAEIINRTLNKEILLSDGVKELKYGSLAGRTWDEIEALTGDTLICEKDRSVEFDYTRFGGDSAADFKARILSFVEELKSQHRDKMILVTTHSGVIKSAYVLFPQKEKQYVFNISIHEFEL